MVKVCIQCNISFLKVSINNVNNKLIAFGYVHVLISTKVLLSMKKGDQYDYLVFKLYIDTKN